MNARILIVGLGNELLGDDGLGILTARRLKADNALCADVVECNFAGMGLLDVISGYAKVIFIDAIRTRQYAPGTVLELDINSFRSIPSDSPHHTGLAELISMAQWLEIDFPEEIVVIAVEVEDSFLLGAKLSDSVKNAIDPLMDRIKKQLHLWNEDKVMDRTIFRQFDRIRLVRNKWAENEIAD